MKMKRFMRSIWNINALLIFAVGIGTLVLVSVAIVPSLLKYGWNAGERVITHQHDKVEEFKNEVIYRKVSPIQGSSFFMIELDMNQKYKPSFYEKVSYSTRNLLFVDPRQELSYWAFNDHQNLIVEYYKVILKSKNEEGKKFYGVLLNVVGEDTNSDQKLTYEDRRNIWIVEPKSRQTVLLIESIDQFAGEELLDENRLVIFYERDERFFETIVDLKDLKLMKTREISEPEKQEELI